MHLKEKILLQPWVKVENQGAPFTCGSASGGAIGEASSAATWVRFVWALRGTKGSKTAHCQQKWQHTLRRALQGLWWKLFYQWECFPTLSHNSQSAAISKSLQLFMRWGKPSSRWKTTRHLELMESLLKSSNRLRKALTMAPRSHPEAREWWRNSRWHLWCCALVTILRQGHKASWKNTLVVASQATSCWGAAFIVLLFKKQWIC